MNFKNNILILLILIIASTFLYTFRFSILSPSQTFDTTDRPVLRILFIGNSYTFVNDMPKTVALLAEHDPDAPFRVETQMLTAPGATLAQLSSLPEAKTILSQKQWDYVVLQPQSLWATEEKRTYLTDIGLSSWVSAIKKSGAKPVFFMTWPRQPGDAWYKNPTYSFLKSPGSMYKRIKGYSKSFVSRYDMLMVPVGDLWVTALNKYPDLHIYAQDGTHPSRDGSMLVALAFYKKLVSATIRDIKYHPVHITPQEQEALFTITDAIE